MSFDRELREMMAGKLIGIPMTDPWNNRPPRSREEELEAKLREATGVIRKQQEAINELQETQPRVFGTVLTIDRTKPDAVKVVVAAMGVMLSMKPLSNEVAQKLEAGARVACIGNVIVDLADVPPIGKILTITDASADDQYFECEVGGGAARFIAPGDMAVEAGDRVVVDGLVAVANLGKSRSAHKVTTRVNVAWDDIGGQLEAKEALREAIELPISHSGLYEKYGRRAPRGVLLFGPPGCGKTLLAKAVATSIDKNATTESPDGFMFVKGPELLSKWVGESEQNIRSLFARARAHHALTGYPAVIFIDEAEAILSARGGKSSGGALSQTIIPQFLAEMDGVEASSAIVILGTNLPDALDPAIVRDGRIDRRIKVTRPDRSSCEDIFRIHLRDVPLAKGFEDPAAYAAARMFDPASCVMTITRSSGEQVPFGLSDIINGAMIENVCQLSISSAIARDIEAGRKKPTGLTSEDVDAVIARMAREQKDIDHSAALREFCSGFAHDIASIV